MKIQSIATRIPSRCVTNDMLLQAVRDANSDLTPLQLAAYSRRLTLLLGRAGAETRYIRDVKNGERALDLANDAVKSALQSANARATDVDLLIYCGVGRGFLEPANAAFICQSLGLKADSFDLAEACVSWVRALQVAYHFIKTETYKNVLVVNAEFNVLERWSDDSLAIRSQEELRYTFPAFTIGEAASATLLTESSDTWKFTFSSEPALADLCTLPLPGFQDFASSSPRIGLNGANRLVSFGQELSSELFKRLLDLVRATISDRDQIDHWFPHGASERLCLRAAQELGLGERLQSKVFRRYGNVVSASIPVGIGMRLEDGSLKRGQRVVLCPAGAGASLGVADFIF